MTNDVHDITALAKRVEVLKTLVKNLEEYVCLSEKRQSEAFAKAMDATREELSQIHRNQRLLYELVVPVFTKMFPNDWKYQAEFDRILGTAPKPDDPKKSS
jgi:hypothetical protein